VTGVEVVAFTAVLVMGLATVFSRDPLRQVVVNGVFSLMLVVLFLVLQAPDVALSELVVGTVAFPFVILATTVRVRESGDDE
jgi:uncharacterized MnhB-related membrane protein